LIAWGAYITVEPVLGVVARAFGTLPFTQPACDSQALFFYLVPDYCPLPGWRVALCQVPDLMLTCAWVPIISDTFIEETA